MPRLGGRHGRADRLLDQVADAQHDTGVRQEHIEHRALHAVHEVAHIVLAALLLDRQHVVDVGLGRATRRVDRGVVVDRILDAPADHALGADQHVARAAIVRQLLQRGFPAAHASLEALQALGVGLLEVGLQAVGVQRQGLGVDLNRLSEEHTGAGLDDVLLARLAAKDEEVNGSIAVQGAQRLHVGGLAVGQAQVARTVGVCARADLVPLVIGLVVLQERLAGAAGLDAFVAGAALPDVRGLERRVGGVGRGFLRHGLHAAELQLGIQRPGQHLHDGFVQVVLVALEDRAATDAVEERRQAREADPPAFLGRIRSEVGHRLLQRGRQHALGALEEFLVLLAEAPGGLRGLLCGDCRGSALLLLRRAHH